MAKKKEFRYLNTGLADYLIDQGFTCFDKRFVKDIGTLCRFEDTAELLEALRLKFISDQEKQEKNTK